MENFCDTVAVKYLEKRPDLMTNTFTQRDNLPSLEQLVELWEEMHPTKKTMMQTAFYVNESKSLEHLHASNILLCGYINDHIVSSSADKSLNIISKDDKVISIRTSKLGHTAPILSVVKSSDNIIMGGIDGKLTMLPWDALLEHDFEKNLQIKAHDKYISTIATNNQCIATGSYDKTVHIYNSDLEILKTLNFPGSVEKVKYDKNQLFICCRNSSFIFQYISADDILLEHNMNEKLDDFVSFDILDFDIRNNHLILTTNQPSGRMIYCALYPFKIIRNYYGISVDNYFLPKIRFIYDACFVATSADHELYLYKIESDVEHATIDNRYLVITGHRNIIRGLAVEGNKILSCGFDGILMETDLIEKEI